jgi:hypothetical protein
MGGDMAGTQLCPFVKLFFGYTPASRFFFVSLAIPAEWKRFIAIIKQFLYIVYRIYVDIIFFTNL